MNKKTTLEVTTFLHTFVNILGSSGQLTSADSSHLHELLYKVEDTIQNPPKKKTKKTKKD